MPPDGGAIILRLVRSLTGGVMPGLLADEPPPPQLVMNGIMIKARIIEIFMGHLLWHRKIKQHKTVEFHPIFHYSLFWMIKL